MEGYLPLNYVYEASLWQIKNYKNCEKIIINYKTGINIKNKNTKAGGIKRL